MMVYVTRDQAEELAHIQIGAANSRVNNPGSPHGDNQPTVTLKIKGYPKDLVAVAKNTITDSGPITLTIFGLDENGGAQTGVAVFENPVYAAVNEQIFEKGWAADVVPKLATLQWKAYTGYSIQCTNAAAKGNFSIWAMPNESRYTLIGTTQENCIIMPSQRLTAISAGMEEGAYVKPGMNHDGEMRVKLHRDMMGRFDWANVTVRVDLVEEQKIIAQKLYAMGGKFVPSAGAFDATIMFTDLAIMFAQQAASPVEYEMQNADGFPN